MTRTRPTSTAAALPSSHLLLAVGILAGLAGGASMALVAMLRSAGVGLGFWLPLQLIAGLLLGVNALLGGYRAVLLGIVLHLLVASAWGAAFAGIIRGRLDAVPALVAGLFYGTVVWLLMTYLLLPWANRTMFDRVNLSMSWFFFYHLVYGATLALTPWLARKLEARRQRVDAALASPA